MSKLSHIEDIEKRQGAGQAQAKDIAMQNSRRVPVDNSCEKASSDKELTSKEEIEFHGLDANQPLSMGHKTLIIFAAIVVFVAILYIVNSWIHFI